VRGMRDEKLAEDKLYLLLDREGGNEQFAHGLTLDDIAIDVPSPVPPAKVKTRHLFNENKDANSLVFQKWGVIVPKGDRGTELFGYIADLVAWREKEQGMKVVPFEVEPNMDAAAAVDWVVNTLSQIDKEDRPRYLLILGDLHEVSAELQVALSTRYFAGRLAFANPDDYRAYVAKVIRHEKAEPTAKHCKALLYATRYDNHDLARAMKDAERKLIDPLLELSSERHENGKIPARFEMRNTQEVSNKEEMLGVVRSAPLPSLFLSVSHGHGASRDRPEAEKRSIQGALAFDGHVYLTAEDAKSGPFLPGGFWFMFACYGAGTPKRSAYQHWYNVQDVTENLPKSDENPYIAALPKAALANPDGPLAIVGHLDLAWASSYNAAAGFRNQAARFTELADIANKKDWRRVGPIFGDFIRDLVDVDTKIMNAIDAEKAGDSPPMDRRKRTNLWMLRQDLAAYILLGDPAAYLPFARRVPRPACASSDENEGDDE
jgi:hypothetical protein